MKSYKIRKSPLRRSLLWSLLVFVVLLSATLAFFSFGIYRRDMIERYQNYAGDAVEFFARRIDGDDLEQCMRSGVKSEKYRELQQLANDMKETHDLIYLYIIEPLRPDPPDNMMDVLAAWTAREAAEEAETLTDLGNLTGDYYPSEIAKEYLARMDHDARITYFRNDSDFGRIYTAIRPVFNSHGQPIAVVCGDIMVDDIYGAELRYGLLAGLVALGFSVLVLLAMNLWFGSRIVEPIGRLQRSAEQFEDKCRRRADVSELTMEDPAIHTGDEIEALSASIVSMVQDVQSYAAALLEKDHEIDSMKVYVNQLDVLAYRDTLTGAGNKAAYEKAVKRLDWEILTGNARFALLMADLNFLKRINDSYGHDRGNEYIRRMYAMIKEVFQSAPVFRVGGDEFLIVIEGDEVERCEENLSRVRENMRLTREDKSLEPWQQVSTAFGLAAFRRGEDADTESVFRRADAAMYEDKKHMHAERTG